MYPVYFCSAANFLTISPAIFKYFLKQRYQCTRAHAFPRLRERCWWPTRDHSIISFVAEPTRMNISCFILRALPFRPLLLLLFGVSRKNKPGRQSPNVPEYCRARFPRVHFARRYYTKTFPRRFYNRPGQKRDSYSLNRSSRGPSFVSSMGFRG